MLDFQLKALQDTTANCSSCPRAARWRLYRDGVYVYVCNAHAEAAAASLLELIKRVRNGL